MTCQNKMDPPFIVRHLQPGDICLDCQKVGLKKHLRNFYINLQMEQILKCESDTCLYPHNDEVTSSSSDDTDFDIPNVMEPHTYLTNSMTDSPSTSNGELGSYTLHTLQPAQIEQKMENKGLMNNSQRVGKDKKPKIEIISIENVKQNVDETTVGGAQKITLPKATTHNINQQKNLNAISPKPISRFKLLKTEEQNIEHNNVSVNFSAHKNKINIPKADIYANNDQVKPKAIKKARQESSLTAAPYLDQVMHMLNMKKQSTASENFNSTSSPERVLTRSATCLALFGIALSSFSLKQMLANNANKSSTIPMRKLY